MVPERARIRQGNVSHKRLLSATFDQQQCTWFGTYSAVLDAMTAHIAKTLVLTSNSSVLKTIIVKMLQFVSRLTLSQQ